MSEILKSLDQIQKGKDNLPLGSKSSSKEDAKTSFVKYLLMQKQLEPNSKAIQAIQAHLEEKIQTAFESLSKKLQVISQAASEEMVLNLEKNKNTLIKIKEDIEIIREWTKKEFQSLKREDSPFLESPRDSKEKIAAQRYYENENLKLKQINMRLIRQYYSKRFDLQKNNQPASEPANFNQDYQGATGLFFQIRQLEEKKAELIKDNIQINEFSEQILNENQRLQEMLEELRKKAAEFEKQ